MTADALNLIGLALKAGRLEIGEEPVEAVCRGKRAKVLLLASDAAENSVRRAERFAQAGKVLCVTVPAAKAELGHATGRASCAMLVLTDAGLAASLMNKLAAEDDRYTEQARTLAQMAERTLRRQKDRRARAKSAEKKRAKPWAAPPPGKK